MEILDSEKEQESQQIGYKKKKKGFFLCEDLTKNFIKKLGTTPPQNISKI